MFERLLRPGVADVDGNGRARLDAIARWLQDVAYEDIIDAGFEGRGAWIVRRLRLRVDSFPRFGDVLTVSTFCSGIGRFSAERRTTVSGGSARVEAVGLWICLDPDTWRPMRFAPEFVDAYAPSANGRDAPVRLRHHDPPAGGSPSEWRFRATDLDIAGHVNNSHYWAPLEEELARASEPKRIDAEIEFRDPASAGEVALVGDARARWVLDAEGKALASMRVRPTGA